MLNLGDLLGDLDRLGEVAPEPVSGWAVVLSSSWGTVSRTDSGPEDLPGGVAEVDARSGPKGPIGIGLFSLFLVTRSILPSGS